MRLMRQTNILHSLVPFLCPALALQDQMCQMIDRWLTSPIIKQSAVCSHLCSRGWRSVSRKCGLLPTGFLCWCCADTNTKTYYKEKTTFEKDKKHLIQIRTHPIVVELKTLDDAAPIQMTWEVNPSASIITQIQQIPARLNFTGQNWDLNWTMMMIRSGWCVLEQCWRVFNLVAIPQELDEADWCPE